MRALIFMLLSTAYFAAVFQRYSLGVVTEELSRELNVGTVELGFMSSAYFMACAASQPLVGVLTDRFSPLIMVAGCLGVGAIGTWVFAEARSISMAFLGRIVVGVGLSGVFVPGVKAIGMAYGADKFASANGVFIAIGNAGSVLGTAIVVWLISMIGWRSSFVAVGAALICLAVLCWAVDRAGRSNMERCAGNDAARVEGPSLQSICRGPAVFLRDRNLWLVNLFMFSRFGSQAAFQGVWGVPYIMSVYGETRERAAISVMMIGLGYIVGSPIAGCLADRITKTRGSTFAARRIVLAATTGLYALTWVPLTLLPGKYDLWVCNALLFMMGAGASSVGLSFSIVNESYHPKMAGQAMSIANVMSIFGAAAVPPIVGAIIQKATDAGVGARATYGHSMWPCLIAGFVSWLSVILLSVDQGIGPRARAEQ
ncbi:MAG: MFS transporter [Clostridia bacterium]|nr:MFS transporter [Clostridia bacterium]